MSIVEHIEQGSRISGGDIDGWKPARNAGDVVSTISESIRQILRDLKDRVDDKDLDILIGRRVYYRNSCTKCHLEKVNQ